MDQLDSYKKKLRGAGLHKLSPEISSVSDFSFMLGGDEVSQNKELSEALKWYLISLDYICKGVTVHCNIPIYDEDRQKLMSEKLLAKLSTMAKGGVVFPMLLGDQFQSMSYFCMSRLGNDVQTIHSYIEELVCKVHDVPQVFDNKEDNLESLYNHFYVHLPTFYGYGLKGASLILGQEEDLQNSAFDLGIDFGYM